jgi:hypothetical protein
MLLAANVLISRFEKKARIVSDRAIELRIEDADSLDQHEIDWMRLSFQQWKSEGQRVAVELRLTRRLKLRLYAVHEVSDKRLHLIFAQCDSAERERCVYSVEGQSPQFYHVRGRKVKWNLDDLL